MSLRFHLHLLVQFTILVLFPSIKTNDDYAYSRRVLAKVYGKIKRGRFVV